MTTRKRKTVRDSNSYLVPRVDLFAASILDQVTKQDPPLGLEQKLDVLDKLSKWLAVRNKIAALDNPDSEGASLNDLRRRLKTGGRHGHPVETDTPWRKSGGHLTSQPERDGRPGEHVTRLYGRRPNDSQPGDGVDLAALRARLPRPDAGGDDDDRDDVGDEASAPAGDPGGVRAGLPKHDEPDDHDFGGEHGV